MVRVAVVVGLAVGVLAAFGVAGCGGSDRLSAQEYRSQLTDLSTHRVKAYADLEKMRTAKSGARIRAGLVSFAAAEELFAADVEKLKPPKNAEKPNALLASGAHDVTLRVRELVSALPVSRNPRLALARLDAIRSARGAAEEVRALRQLKQLGYIKQA